MAQVDAARSSPALRWSVALALSVLYALLVTLLLNAPPPPLPVRNGSAVSVPRSSTLPARQHGGAGHLPSVQHPGATGKDGERVRAAQIRITHPVRLLLIALATYAWVLYPAAGSLVITIAVLVSLLWAWAIRQASGLEPAVLGLLTGTAVWQRQRRSRQLQRMQQLLDDLGEERTVKDQAIELARHTRGALQKKLSRYTQLQLIAEALSNTTDLAPIAQLAVNRAFTLIGKSDVCLLFLVDQERQELSLFASEKRASIATVRAKHGDQFDRYVLRTHAPLIVSDARRDFRFTVTASAERAISSVIACPLFLGQSPAGVLRLDSAQPGVYTQDDLRFLDILLNLVATAMTNAKLFAQTQRLAMTDGLTDLMLRRPFLEQLTRELTRSSRSREPVSVLMLDVDHFKRHNDTFGHTAGDLILKGVAKVLLEAVPPGGVIARYGGEEFVVLLPQAERPQAHEAAEKIRRFVEEHVQESGRVAHHPTAALPAGSSAQVSARSERRVKEIAQVGATRERQIEPGGAVTVSIGVASFPADAQAELELIRVADQRLYQAKREGRNRVVSS